MEMKIFVTGVSGFIGSHLVKILEGMDLYGLVRFGDRPTQHEGYVPVYGDLTDYHYLAKIVKEIKPEIIMEDQGTVVHFSVDMTGSCVIQLQGEGGISVLPYVPDPAPGSAADGFRIISSCLQDDRYLIVAEGPAGTQCTLNLYAAEDQLVAFPKKTNFEKIPGGYKIEINFESSVKPFVRKEVVLKLKDNFK